MCLKMIKDNSSFIISNLFSFQKTTVYVNQLSLLFQKEFQNFICKFNFEGCKRNTYCRHWQFSSLFFLTKSSGFEIGFYRHEIRSQILKILSLAVYIPVSFLFYSQSVASNRIKKINFFCGQILFIPSGPKFEKYPY